ncbi:MAG: hypothetical protein AB7G44_06005 [Bacteroidia bacterium]
MKKIFMALMAVCGFYFAQGQNAISTVSANYEYVFNDSSELTMPDSLQFVMLKKRITVNVSTGNTSGVSKLAVLLGSSEGSNDIFYKEFDWGQSGDFGDGTSYHSSGSSVTIGTGVHQGREIYYVEVFAMKEDETRSESRKQTIVFSP